MTRVETDWRLEEGKKLFYERKYNYAISALERGLEVCNANFDNCPDKGCGWCMEVYLPNLMKFHYFIGISYFKLDLWTEKNPKYEKAVQSFCESMAMAWIWKDKQNLQRLRTYETSKLFLLIYIIL